MSEIVEKIEKIENEDFGKMLEEMESVKLYTGATVTGTVMGITDTEIRLDLGAKLTGIITKDQITDSNDVNLADLFKIGDEVDAKVISKSDRDGIAILSKKMVDKKVFGNLIYMSFYTVLLMPLKYLERSFAFSHGYYDFQPL